MVKELRMNKDKVSLVIMIALGIVVILYVISSVRKRRVSENIRISELISASLVLVNRAGERVVEVRGMDDAEIGRLSKGLTKEGKQEFVTFGDKESHQIIVSGLMSLWPNLKLQSEENDMPFIGVAPVSRQDPEVMSVAQRDEAVPLDELTVWIDPLDATQEYTEGKENKPLLKFVTVMVCIAVRGYPVAGIIHQPFSRVTNWGWVGHGVSRSLQGLQEKEGGAKDLTVIYSRSHAGEVSSVANEAFPSSTYKLNEVIAGGSGYKVLEVVKGNADLYLHTTRIKKWDICAGNAVLNAVGGKMTTLKGKEVDYGFKGSPANEEGIVAAVPEQAQQRYLSRLQGNSA